MIKAKDITGQKFGRLTAIKFSHKVKKTHCWLFKCDCGTIKTFQKNHVTGGETKSCGCFQKEIISKISKKHKLCDTSEYSIWQNMKDRCYNKKCRSYKWYGARGIKVCDRWEDSFENFYNDMGMRDSPKLAIERIDNALGYSRENCKWATKEEQGRNKRNNLLLKYKNKTKCLIEWCEELNLNYSTMHSRIAGQKWSVEKAFLMPIQQKRAG